MEDYHDSFVFGDERKSWKLSPVWLRYYHEIREQCKVALPTLVCMLLYRFPWLISLRFVGGIGADELAAAALASTLCNVTGMSLSVGLSSALTTLTSQARGDLEARRKSSSGSKLMILEKEESTSTERTSLMSEEAPKESYTRLSSEDIPEAEAERPLLPLVYLYRGLFVQLIVVLPVGIWWIVGIKSVLVYLGQEDKLSAMTADYLRVLAPGLWSYSINWTLTAWLQAIEMAEIPAYGAAAGLLLHVPFNLLFIHGFGMGYLGCALATTVLQFIQPSIIVGYLFVTRAGRSHLLRCMLANAVGRNRLTFWKEAQIAVMIRGIWNYLGLAVPGIVVISEWWASEISIFLAGRLYPSPWIALVAMTLYQSINTTCFMFPVSFGVAGSTRVGNKLGEGESARASFAAESSVLTSALISGLLGVILYLTPHAFFPSLFAPTEVDLVESTATTIPLLALYVFADGIQSALNGVAKGCGRQVVTMFIVVFAYWIVGLPLAYYLSFVKHHGNLCDDDYFCGVRGLVAGMTVGTWVHMILLSAVIIFTDWNAEARKARDRLRQSIRDHHGLSKFSDENVIGLETLAP